ncbi:MAG: SPOR domain-containing protein [Mariprofundaceae bacterium]
MARHDFAQVEAPQPEDVKPMRQGKVLLLIIVALTVVAGGFAIGFMVGQEMGMQKATSKDEARLVAQLKKQQQELTTLREAAKKRLPEVSTTQVGELTFYNELPQQSVDPEPLQMHPSSAKQSVSSVKNRKQTTDSSEKASEKLLKQIIEQELKQSGDKKSAHASEASSSVKSSPEKLSKAAGEYFLQIASFQEQNAAKKFFPKLSKVGYEGVIKRVELPGLGTWYRVYVGPFVSEQASKNAKKNVKSKLNITGLIVKGG